MKLEVLILTLSFSVCALFVQPIIAVEIIGHRGASGDAPENTLASVNLAWQRNADAVEIDIYLTKDHQIVAFHDGTTKRTAGGVDKPIVEQTLRELKKLDAGSWKNIKYAGEKIPTLKEILATIPEEKRLFIEIKCGVEILSQLKEELKEAGKKPEQTAIISFSIDVVRESKKLMPELETYFIAGFKQDKETKIWEPELSSIIEKAVKAKVDGVDLMYCPVLNQQAIDEIKKAKLGIYVWTVNIEQDVKNCVEMGIEGVTTDYPGKMKKLATGK
jgi:glycerophosphoryl diester phosphodiesterase